MTAINKAETMVYRALQRAILEDRLQLYLVHSKINVPGSPIYNPWENLLPILVPTLLGLFLIGICGILIGLSFMVVGVFLATNFSRKILDKLLYNRAKNVLLANYDSCCRLWEFGGIVLVLADNKKHGCLAPEGNWKEFVILTCADLMLEKPANTEDVANAQAA